MATQGGLYEIIQLLLHAGADPTVVCGWGDTALDMVRDLGEFHCADLIEAALAEPQRTRALFKARALVATRRIVPAAAASLTRKSLPAVLSRAITAMAVPAHLAGRLAQAHELPRVFIQHDSVDEEQEQLVACVKYALGLEGGGGVVFEGREPTVGMLPAVFVELLELLVPK